MAQRSPNPLLNVLFVCIGNACRSQMAEALANNIAGGWVRAWSAGSSPLGQIIPETHDAMREKGITLEGHWSKGLKAVSVDKMDFVVGMGCEVYCPLPASFKGQFIEWNIPDPYGHDPEYFRGVCDLIERQVTSLINDLDERRQAASRGGGRAKPES